jgi:hypothetical protein
MERFLHALIVALMIFSLFLLSFTFLSPALGSTDVSDLISSDTTWTIANNPYTLTGSITVATGITLTIEEGVTVNLNGYSLQVNGELIAVGSATDKVTFNGGVISFSSSSTGWNEQTGLGSIIQEANINQTTISSVNAIKISKNTITAPDDATVGALAIGGFSVIADNTIISTTGKGYGIIVKQGIASISGNIISGFAMGIWAASEASIQQNSILNCGCGIGVGKIIGTSFDTYQFGEVSVTIKGNTIANNYIGIGGPLFPGKVPINNVVATGEATTEGNFIDNNTYGLALGALGSFRYNTISNSQVAVAIYDTSGSLSPHFDSNNFVDYKQNSFYQLGPKDVLAENNWWGTTDLNIINTSIYDKIDNSLLGSINVGNILELPNTQAPSKPPTSVPDLPMPEWSPTTNPDTSASPTPKSGDSNSYFQVESNSTITELFFNSTSSELSFTVTGPSGNTGYVQYTIAKSLLPGIQNVKVFLDGNQLNINITSTEDSWLLYFTYHHSSHQIIINLAAGTQNTFDDYSSLLLPVVIAAVLLVTGFVVWRKKLSPKP